MIQLTILMKKSGQLSFSVKSKLNTCVSFFFLIGLTSISSKLFAQSNIGSPSAKLHKNYIGLYVGIFEGNFNYERNLVLRTIGKGEKNHRYTNEDYLKERFLLSLRLGYGCFTNFQGVWQYPNMAVVLGIGKKNSLFEINLGAKYLNSIGTTTENFQSTTIIPDLYAGYRYENPDKHFFFRAGHGYPTGIFIFGFGYKF